MRKRFIDLFAGCGGLSLGLTLAGWQGVFAIERSSDAFLTLKRNLIDGSSVPGFDWPDELPCKAMTTSELLAQHTPYLVRIEGTIDLIAGGPPCQGFSFAGRRNPNDPRNKLTEEYIKIVELVRPKYLLLENVKGFTSGFRTVEHQQAIPYSEVVAGKLEQLGYKVFKRMLNASRFGVPQPRPRFIMIAMRSELYTGARPFMKLGDVVREFRRANGLPSDGETTVWDAISDLEVEGAELVPSVDTKGFQQIRYSPRKLTPYQKLMRRSLAADYSPNSLRLPNHTAETSARFRRILTRFPKGTSLQKSDLEALGTKKQAFTPLHPDKPSKTITTLPDDLLHYSEPRILTVRENARIQSFPDWYEFLGKYTTGGARRREDCPRYSQVGNAVPPLMAEALGRILSNLDTVDE